MRFDIDKFPDTSRRRFDGDLFPTFDKLSLTRDVEPPIFVVDFVKKIPSCHKNQTYPIEVESTNDFWLVHQLALTPSFRSLTTFWEFLKDIFY